jgi:hypothetical protein
MSDTAVIETAAAPKGGLPREAPEIPVANVQLQHDGLRWKEWEVRLPGDAIFADLGDPRIWQKVQANSRVALVKGDKLRIVAYDESWCCEALVAAANGESISLSKPQRFDMQARTEILGGDDKYDIAWVGSGYRLRRKSDLQLIGNVVATKGLAEIALRNMYGTPAGGR